MRDTHDQDLDDLLQDLWTDHARLQHEEIGHLRSALQSNREIGTAIGFLMGRYDLEQDQALAALVRTSRDGNVKLRDVAARVLAERRMPERSAS